MTGLCAGSSRGPSAGFLRSSEAFAVVRASEPGQVPGTPSRREHLGMIPRLTNQGGGTPR